MINFIVNKNQFEEGLNIVERAISSRNTLPVLNNVLLTVNKDYLELLTTNLEIAIKTRIKIEANEEGKTTAPVKLLSNYISLLSTDKVVIKMEEKETLSLQTDKSNTKIKCIIAEEFPLIPQIETEKSIEMNVKDFLNNISKIVFASALDELRPILAGVFVKVENGKIFTVATDSYRLVETQNNTNEQNNFSVIIPSRAILELSRVLHKYPEKKINIDISKNQIRFTCDQIELTSRLIEGQYPDYKKIIPEKTDTITTINTQELITTIKRASLFAKENSNSIKIDIKKDCISVIVDSVQTGSEKAELKAETIGEDKVVAFNAQYLIDALSNIETEFVDLGINTAITPGVIKPNKQDGILHIVMPLKV